MTKQRLLKKASEVGVTVDLESLDFDQITLISPKGKCFQDGSHLRVVAHVGPGFRKELWQDALEDLNDIIKHNMPAQKCDETTCSAWVDGACDWWAE